MTTEDLQEDSISKLRENILSSLSQDYLLSDLNTRMTLQDLLYKIKVEEEGCIKLRVKKFDGTMIGKFNHTILLYVIIIGYTIFVSRHFCIDISLNNER